MEDVHVRQPPADPFQPVKQKTRFEERRVERLAVETDEGARASQGVGDEQSGLSFAILSSGPSRLGLARKRVVSPTTLFLFLQKHQQRSCR